MVGTNPSEAFKFFQDHITRNATRSQQYIDSFIINPSDPPMSPTPKDSVWKRGKTELFRYHSQTETQHPIPILVIPWLGISRTHALDLLPGNSFMEFLVQKGYDVYLLDWGEIAEEDKALGFEEAALKLVPAALQRALEISEAAEINLMGVCLGGTIGACYLARSEDTRVKNFVAIVAPIDFEEGGLFRSWLKEDSFPVDLLVRKYGGLPASLMGDGFKMLRPTQEAQAMTGLWMNLDNPEYPKAYKAMNRWATDFIGMPGKFFTQLSRDLYRDNKLINQKFVLQGKSIDLRKITQPLLVAAATQDYIVPPLSAKGMLDAVSSSDKEYIELPGGHISVFSGRQAHQTLWPKLHDWLSAHSN